MPPFKQDFPMRAMSLLLGLSMIASAAAAPAEYDSTPPTAAPPTQDIDVDAMARAKDVGAAQPENSGTPEAPVTEAAPAEAPPAQPETPAAKEAASSAPALAAPAVDPQEKRMASSCEARASTLLDAAQKGDFAAATKDFDAKMRSASPPDKLKQMWDSLTRFGTLQARGQAHPGKGEGYYIVMTPLIFEKANLVSQVACGSDGLIAGFNIKPISAVQ
jgi:hypothetical protein